MSTATKTTTKASRGPALLPSSVVTNLPRTLSRIQTLSACRMKAVISVMGMSLSMMEKITAT